MMLPATPEDDVFLPSGYVREDLLTDAVARALYRSVQHARETRWESLRSPHIFMGLLAAPDAGIRDWVKRLHWDISGLLQQFHEMFYQEACDSDPLILLHREFLSDNVIHLLRDAYRRARNLRRPCLTSMDLLISLLTISPSIVAEYFVRLGISPSRLTELAVLAEQAYQSDGDKGKKAKA